MNIEICKKCREYPNYFLCSFKRVLEKQVGFCGIIEKEDCTLVGCSFFISYQEYKQLFENKENLLEKAKNPLEILEKVEIKHCPFSFEQEVVNEHRDLQKMS